MPRKVKKGKKKRKVSDEEILRRARAPRGSEVISADDDGRNAFIWFGGHGGECCCKDCR